MKRELIAEMKFYMVMNRFLVDLLKEWHATSFVLVVENRQREMLENLDREIRDLRQLERQPADKKAQQLVVVYRKKWKLVTMKKVTEMWIVWMVDERQARLDAEEFSGHKRRLEELRLQYKNEVGRQAAIRTGEKLAKAAK